MAIAQTSSTLDDFFTHSTEMLFIAAQSGAIVKMSRALAQVIGAELTEGAQPAGIGALVHPDDRGVFDKAWERTRAGSLPVNVEVRLRTAGGSFDTFQCSVRQVAEREEVYGALRVPSASATEKVKLTALQAIADNMPVCLWATDARGVFVLHDGKALESTGLRPGQHVGLNILDLYPPEETGPIRSALAGNLFHAQVDALGRSWELWLLPVKNEHGELVHVTGVNLDVTEARKIELELRAKLDLVEKQQRVIRSLSTPIIQVWDQVLTLPVVGMVDSVRAAEVMDSILNEAVRTRARYAILDLTGVEAMDTATASHLLNLNRALRLLGAEGVITGIHPAIAQTMVGLGVDLTMIVTLATLREGLTYCIRQMSRESGRS